MGDGDLGSETERPFISTGTEFHNNASKTCFTDKTPLRLEWILQDI